MFDLNIKVIRSGIFYLELVEKSHSKLENWLTVANLGRLCLQATGQNMFTYIFAGNTEGGSCL